jgi:hypothetical protein
VNDLASIIAEVAIERAQDRSLKLAQRRVGEFLRCGRNGGIAFKQTCELISNFRMMDLAGSGQALAQAVSEDLMASTLNASVVRDIVDSSVPPSVCPELQWSALTPIVQNALAPDSRRESDEVMAHRFIGMMAQGCVSPLMKDNACNPVQLSLAVLSECEQGLDCNTSSIQFYLSHASELFEGCSAQAIPKQIFDPVSFVAKGLEVLAPKADVSARRQLRVAVSMLTDILKYQAWASTEEGKRLSQLISMLDNPSPKALSIQVLLSHFQAPLWMLIEKTDAFDRGMAARAQQALLKDLRIPEEILNASSGISEEVLKHIQQELKKEEGEARLAACKSAKPHLMKLCELSAGLQALPDATRNVILRKDWLKALETTASEPTQTDVIMRLKAEWERAEELASLIKEIRSQNTSNVWERLLQLQTALTKMTEAAKLTNPDAVARLQPLLMAIRQGDLVTLCKEASSVEKGGGFQAPLEITLADIRKNCESTELAHQQTLAEWKDLRGQLEAVHCSTPGLDMALARVSEGSYMRVGGPEFTRKALKSLCDARNASWDAVARFMDSLLSNDFQSALLHLLTAIPNKPDAKQVKVLSALTSFLKTYGQTQALTPEDAAQIREARKKSISSLIDLLASREERPGQWIASLAVNPGLAGAWQFKRGADDDKGSEGTALLRLNLPVGLSLDCFDKLRKNFGFHGSVFVLDLGQYAEAATKKRQGVPEPEFETALAFGVQAGLLLNSVEDPINLSVDVRYSPATGVRTNQPDDLTPEPGRVSLGLTLSYLIPLIDFN